MFRVLKPIWFRTSFNWCKTIASCLRTQVCGFFIDQLASVPHLSCDHDWVYTRFFLIVPSSFTIPCIEFCLLFFFCSVYKEESSTQLWQNKVYFVNKVRGIEHIQVNTIHWSRLQTSLFVILNEFSRKKTAALNTLHFNMLQIIAIAAIISLNIASIQCIRFVFCENFLVSISNSSSGKFLDA